MKSVLVSSASKSCHGQFIEHRLKAAGGTGGEIAPECAELIFEVTGGVPRLVNQFCDMALLYAWSAESPVVDKRIAEMILDDGMFFAADRISKKENAPE